MTERTDSNTFNPYGDGGSGASSQDPDAQGLPPGVTLPEAHGFRRDQLWARMIVSLTVLVILGLLTAWSQDHRGLYGSCTAVAGVATMVLLVRYLIARRRAIGHAENGTRKGERP